MSSSVMRARTRMCRTMVAIILGGNLCGGMWQRPQFVRKRFSPSTRAALFCAAVDGAAVDGPAVEGAAADKTTTDGTAPLDADEFLPDSAATIAARIRTTARIRISNLLVQGETRTDKSPLQSRCWHCQRN